MSTIVFVFGSNLAGRHGRGSALEAYLHYGAVRGQGVGRQGMSYAIPTKDEQLNVLSIGQINSFVREFIIYATKHPELRFEIVRIGCGLAGYEDSQIAPMFKDAPHNCQLPAGWRKP